jgi:hypothetical protein
MIGIFPNNTIKNQDCTFVVTGQKFLKAPLHLLISLSLRWQMHN